MKLLSLLLIPFFLTSCAILNPPPRQEILPDQQAFSQVFTEFQENHQISGFQKLVVDFPNSIWAGRAETIILYARELDQRKVQNKQLRGSELHQALEVKRLRQLYRQLNDRTEQLDKLNRQLNDRAEQLGKLNRQLMDKIEQLKVLLIQSEKHPQ